MNWLKSTFNDKTSKRQESPGLVFEEASDENLDEGEIQSYLDKLVSNDSLKKSSRIQTTNAPERNSQFLEHSYQQLYAQTESQQEANDAFSDQRQSASQSNFSQNRSLNRRSRSNRRLGKSKPRVAVCSSNISDKSSDKEFVNSKPQKKKTQYTNMYLDPSFDINLSKQNNLQSDQSNRHAANLNHINRAQFNIKNQKHEERNMNSFLRASDKKGAVTIQNSLSYLSQPNDDDSSLGIGKINSHQLLNPGERLSNLKLDYLNQSEGMPNVDYNRDSTAKSKKKRSTQKKVKSSEKSKKKSHHKHTNSTIYDSLNKGIKLTESGIQAFADETCKINLMVSPFELPISQTPQIGPKKIVSKPVMKLKEDETSMVYQTNRITSSFLKSEETLTRKVQRSQLHSRKGSNVEMFSQQQYTINSENQEGAINIVTESLKTHDKAKTKNMKLYQVKARLSNKKNERLHQFMTNSVPSTNRHGMVATGQRTGYINNLECLADPKDKQILSSKEDSLSNIQSQIVGTNEEVSKDQKNQAYDTKERMFPKTNLKVSYKDQLSEIENIIMKDLQERKKQIKTSENDSRSPRNRKQHEFNVTSTVIRSSKVSLTPSSSPKRDSSKHKEGVQPISGLEVLRQRSKNKKTAIGNSTLKHNRLLNYLIDQPMTKPDAKVESKYVSNVTNMSSKHVSNRKKDIIKTKPSSNKGSTNKMNQTQSVKELLGNSYKQESQDKEIDKFQNHNENLRMVKDQSQDVFTKQRSGLVQDAILDQEQKSKFDKKKISQPCEMKKSDFNGEESLLLKNNLASLSKNMRSTSYLQEMIEDNDALKKKLDEALKHKPRDQIAELRSKNKSLLDKESKLNNLKHGVLSNKYPRKNNTSQLSATMSSGALIGAVSKSKSTGIHGLYSATKPSSIHSNTTPKVKINSHGSGSLGEKDTSKNSSSANNDKSLENIAEQEDDQLDPSQNVNLDMSSNEDEGEVSIKQIEVNYQLNQQPTVDISKKSGSRLRSSKKPKTGLTGNRSTYISKYTRETNTSANLSYNITEATRKSKFRNQHINKTKTDHKVLEHSDKNSPKNSRLENLARLLPQSPGKFEKIPIELNARVNQSALSKQEKRMKPQKKDDLRQEASLSQMSTNLYHHKQNVHTVNKVGNQSRPQSSMNEQKKSAYRNVLENIQNTTNGIRDKKSSVSNSNNTNLTQFIQHNQIDVEKSRTNLLKDQSVLSFPNRKIQTSINQTKSKHPLASHQQSISTTNNIVSSIKTRGENGSMIRNQKTVPQSSKSHQASISIPVSSKNVRANQNFAKDLLDSEKEKFGDRCPQGFKKLKLLGKGGIALVWLMRITSDKLGENMKDKQVALKQFPKTRSNPYDSTAVNEIEIGNIIFPMQVKDGFEGDNDDEFERGYALEKSEYPGIINISKMLDVVDEKQDLWLVYEVGSDCLSKHLHEVKGEFFKGERIYNISHQQFYNSLLYSKQILVTLIVKVAQTLEVFSHLNIVHSDIKPDNILVEMNEEGTDINSIKFIDFGSAFTSENFSNISGTTPEYLPPEIIDYLDKRSTKPQLAAQIQRNQQPWSFDVWSFGIILIEILTGFPIWMSLKCRLKTSSGKNILGTGLFGVQGREGKKILLKQNSALKSIKNTLKKYECYGLEENEQLIDLITKMLETNPKQRISPSEILQHPFIVEQ